MDQNKAFETIAKLHLEKDQFHQKKIKAKRRSIICLIIGVIFLVPFIVLMVYSLNHIEFTIGVPLFIIFAVLSFIFLEAAIIFFVLMKCVYGYQEENRIKLLDYINREVNKNKKS